MARRAIFTRNIKWNMNNRQTKSSLLSRKLQNYNMNDVSVISCININDEFGWKIELFHWAMNYYCIVNDTLWLLNWSIDELRFHWTQAQIKNVFLSFWSLALILFKKTQWSERIQLFLYLKSLAMNNK